MERVLIFLAFVLFPWPISQLGPECWIIWNVGQGEWVTHVTPERCEHFDMGEHWPRQRIRRLCGDRLNSVYFSHWDMDHVGFVQRVRGIFPRFCLGAAPLGEASARKQALLADLPDCAPDRDVTIWNPEIHAAKKNSANELCRIYRFRHMLIPGDAPINEERRFVDSSGSHSDVNWLVLGHHGSRTSTSDTLLDALPRLQLAIASARHAKYGHPHIETIQKLHAHKIPLLNTEEWGDIEIQE